MSSAVLPNKPVARTGASRLRVIAGIAVLVALHGAALAVMLWSEADPVSMAAFVFAWGVLNFLWLILLRRPAPAAALSLIMIAVLILLSLYKYNLLMTTVSFADVMIVDADTTAFLSEVFPDIERQVGLAALILVPALLLIWWLDPFRCRLRTALLGSITCLALLVGLSLALPYDREDEFEDHNFLSKFARSGAVAAVDLLTRGVLESDQAVAGRLDTALDGECKPAAPLPNIVLIFDESSFDATMMPGTTVPADYHQHFRSFDGKERHFVVEGAGGPSWYTEYNVLAGLSARSYGRFADSVTRLAAGRVGRGLPQSLRRCGYRTFSIYPYAGAFLGARNFQTTAGIEHFLDEKDLGTRRRQPDSFFYDHAARLVAWERGHGPLFLFVYTSANHVPWDQPFRPELTPEWRNPGNWFQIDEYLRRQQMSAHDYSQFVARLKREYPDEPFLVVRFGDHQPAFAKFFIDRTLDPAQIRERIRQFDPRYFTTYYAIEPINFTPADLSSALDTLDAPYLPLLVLEAAGVPLDSSFAEQKKILQRCQGLFYLCAGGAETRRFNRLLIDAGLIKGF